MKWVDQSYNARFSKITNYIRLIKERKNTMKYNSKKTKHYITLIEEDYKLYKINKRKEWKKITNYIRLIK